MIRLICTLAALLLLAACSRAPEPDWSEAVTMHGDTPKRIIEHADGTWTFQATAGEASNEHE